MRLLLNTIFDGGHGNISFIFLFDIDDQYSTEDENVRFWIRTNRQHTNTLHKRQSL
jgi:hypothetical protein